MKHYILHSYSKCIGIDYYYNTHTTEQIRKIFSIFTFLISNKLPVIKFIIHLFIFL